MVPLSHCSKSVSYTHLDVYKRQVVDGVFEFEDVKKAFARLAEGPMGKVLVRVGA